MSKLNSVHVTWAGVLMVGLLLLSPDVAVARGGHAVGGGGGGFRGGARSAGFAGAGFRGGYRGYYRGYRGGYGYGYGLGYYGGYYPWWYDSYPYGYYPVYDSPGYAYDPSTGAPYGAGPGYGPQYAGQVPPPPTSAVAPLTPEEHELALQWRGYRERHPQQYAAMAAGDVRISSLMFRADTLLGPGAVAH